MVYVENEIDEHNLEVHLFHLNHNNQEFTNIGVTIMVPEHIAMAEHIYVMEPD